ncbi:MAG: plasmid pRiA4b ORF-3 family protein [Actinomycetota bacterium]|nr:plasmid pRiA4b ORF-3 family protein [Actinomycetota bacterium]
MSDGRKDESRQPDESPVRALSAVPAECDCPGCSDPDFDPGTLIDDLLAGADGLLSVDDPLEPELLGAGLMTIGEGAGEGFAEALVEGMIPEFEARGTPAALAMLLAIGSATDGPVEMAASAAAARLVAADVPQPGWAEELAQPVTVDDCWHLYDRGATMSVLACSFHRAGRSLAVIMTVDLVDCGAASDIHLLDGDDLTSALAGISGDTGDVEIVKDQVDAAEIRWLFENAMDARAVHDGEPGSVEMDDQFADASHGPDYPVLASLLRARLADLPRSAKPPRSHGHDDKPDMAGILDQVARLVEDPRVTSASFGRARKSTTVPAKRKKADGAAPIFQVKVGLRGAKPPIWRRLEVPGDINLAQLHVVIQTAFAWEDSHLHVFHTPYGDYGMSDVGLGHRPEKSVTLEQVAPRPGAKLTYTYDFGDDWEHDIAVEKVVERDESASYPRCTGGRRAAPPEDCGGIWGYDYLVEVLADATHEEHDERLEWLGLDDASEFDPAAFDAATISLELSTPR